MVYHCIYTHLILSAVLLNQLSSDESPYVLGKCEHASWTEWFASAALADFPNEPFNVLTDYV